MLTSNVMIHDFQPGDFLIFQIESGYALLRVLEVDKTDEIWHLAAYKDFFLDLEMAEAALDNASSLTLDRAHMALTNHAFESTQVARLANAPLTEEERVPVEMWRREGGDVADRSVRLVLGLR